MWSFILCVFPFFPFLWIPTELIGDLLKHSPFFGAPYTVQTLLRESWSGSYGDAFLCGVFRFSTCQHGFSLGIPASDWESLAPASDDVRLDGLCSWKLCTTGIWYMTHQTPPPNNLKIKLKLSKIRKKKKQKKLIKLTCCSTTAPACVVCLVVFSWKLIFALVYY